MKKNLLIAVLVSFGSFAAAAAPKSAVAASSPTVKPIVLKPIVNNAFAPGERLVFALKYEFVTGGTATMEVSEGPIIDGKPSIQIHSNARSNSFVDAFFKVRDFNASLIDRDSLYSRNFHQNLREGHYAVMRNTSLDYKTRTFKYQKLRKGKTTERTGPIETPAFDILSAFFSARTRPLKLGEKFELTVFSDGEMYQLVVNVHTKLQKITVPAGKFECFRLDPAIIGDGIFKAKEGKMQVWLTNDERKMPVLIRSKVAVGSFDAELESYQPK